MKRFKIAASLILAGGIGYGVATLAQQAGGDKADPVKVDPKPAIEMAGISVTSL